jgi:hypothetical protein
MQHPVQETEWAFLGFVLVLVLVLENWAERRSPTRHVSGFGWPKGTNPARGLGAAKSITVTAKQQYAKK